MKNGINPDSVSWESRLTLTTAMDASSVTAITITDTARTNEQQAGAMYNNAVKDLAYQMKLYDSSGKAVLNTFKAAQDAGKSKSDIIAAMTQTIGEVKLAHPTAFKHTADPMVTGTMDISLSSIKPASARDSFMKELGIRGARTILEPQNHCLHVEIPQTMPWRDPFSSGL